MFDQGELVWFVVMNVILYDVFDNVGVCQCLCENVVLLQGLVFIIVECVVVDGGEVLFVVMVDMVFLKQWFELFWVV